MKTHVILLITFLLFSCSLWSPSPDLPLLYKPLPEKGRAPSQEDINVINPIREAEELEVRYDVEVARRISTARVVYVDYELIRRDFPQVAHLSNPEIDEWLLDQTAFMADSQVTRGNANSDIETTSVTKKAYRPEDYGRALVFPIEGADDSSTPIGLIDAKGVGAVNPKAGDHSDGLMTLGEAIREFSYEKMVNRVFLHDEGGLKTVGSYAVIDGGYQVRHADGSSSPAGIILRQAHTRFKGPSSTMSDERTLKVERALRRYGITSAGAYRNKYDYDMLNVQGTKDGAVLDFGGFLVLEDYGGRKGAHFFRLGKTLIDDSGPNAVKPDPLLRVPYEIWGSTVTGVDDPKKDNIWMWSHELARDFSENRASRDDAYNHLRNIWGPVFEKLEKTPHQSRRARSCRDLFINVLGGFAN